MSSEALEPALVTTSAADDVITTEIIRHGFASAAEQMKRTLIRSAFSVTIYDSYDFAVAIYDRRLRLLGQAVGLPIFMGTLSFCVEAALAELGGEAALAPGDVILYNVPYGTGAHQQDAALIMPVFDVAGELLGYTVVKAHWQDLGAKEPYCSDTTDLLQEGTVFPGIKLFEDDRPVDVMMRLVLANTRLPKFVRGDIDAQVAALRVGASEFRRLFERYGPARCWLCIDRMMSHGEQTVRAYVAELPDGRYTSTGIIDDDGVGDAPIEFELVAEVSGSDVTIDLRAAPDAHPGPMNCPRPSTVSACRVALAMLAGGSDMPNEGHFAPLQVLTRSGSMFDPVSPTPCYLYAWPAFQIVENLVRALAPAMPDAVPAGSGGDICATVWWGVREATGESWANGFLTPVGQGGSARGDGANSLMHHGASGCRIPPVEVWEVRNPWLVERRALAPDSCGAGEHRGGLGLDMVIRVTEASFVTPVAERTKQAPWGLAGGTAGRTNGLLVKYRDGLRTDRFGKATGMALPCGSTFEVQSGGGGGHGDPLARDPDAVRRDVRDGYISEEHARRHYPQAF